MPRASAAAVIQTIHSDSTMDFGPEIVSDIAMGIVWVSLDAQQPKRLSGSQSLLLEPENAGVVSVMLAAPPNLKEGMSIWGPPAAGLNLMREIKRRFDPKNLLNPGRFIGGL